MKIKNKVLIAVLLIIATLLSVSGPVFALPTSNDITLWINNERLILDVTPQVSSGRVMVPFRPILEAVGATVTWEPSNQTAFALKSPVALALKPNNLDAFVNGIPVALDAPVKFLDGRLLVPTRFVSEQLGAEVTWLADKRQVQITIPRSVANQSKPQIPESSTLPSNSTNTSAKMRLGDSVYTLIENMGQPKSILLNQYGFYWYAYHDKYKNLQLYGVRDKLIVALYTNSPLRVNDRNLSSALTKQDIRSLLGTPVTSILRGNTEYHYKQNDVDIYNKDNSYLRVFYDTVKGNSARSFLLVNAAEEFNHKGFYGQLSSDVLNNHEYLMFLLVNGVRASSGVDPLVWAPEVIESARKHSTDMANRDFFDHTNPDGLEPYQRLEATGIDFTFTAENLAAGQFDAIHAHEALMNSPGHRKNIFTDTQKLGVGVAAGGSYSIYYTCTFYTPY